MECSSEYFVLNNETKSKDKFDERYIYQGKSVYEVIKVKKGIPMFLEDHMDRVLLTLKLKKLELFISIEEIISRIMKLIAINDIKNGNIKVILNYNKDDKNFITYFIRHSYPTEQQYREGVETILYYAERKDPNSKIIDIDLRKAVNEEIKNNNVYEALLVNKENFITEGSRSNIFFIIDNKIITSPIESVLPGITRKWIFNICRELSVDIIERKVSVEELGKFQGVFMTGTSPDALPISKVNDIIYNSSNERLMKIIMKKFQDETEKYIEKRS
ncbi:branched-chain amino acid aminotransferase [Clostridium bornimense]|uniref:Branched-chain amino acid aminotransferase n=1 Tax=Clostridium bornimense TaxID=1216932 RepID=W6RVJ2_9CLOT|nr:aminotransferase class IV [Clostridium bornimense]CDM68711.1 branched-chain amino acid aminotransferase [Clostridium bornimense]